MFGGHSLPYNKEFSQRKGFVCSKVFRIDLDRIDKIKRIFFA